MKKVFTCLIPLSFILFMSYVNTSKAQCTPPMAETCDESLVFCSLDQLNGYNCENTSTVPFPCTSIRKGYNTSWWGFISTGGDVTIKIKVGSCTSLQGLAYGITGDCACLEEIITRQNPCIHPNSLDSVKVNLLPCKTYYLWVDGCHGDICDFTILTSGGSESLLVPIDPINNIPNHIIDSVCVGACNVPFFVNQKPGCFPTYVWTLDGDELGDNSNEIHIDFPVDGDFVLCVTEYLGNPQSGSICSQVGPQCSTIKVRPLADRIGVKRKFCHESVIPLGFKWHSQRIFQSGIYREQFTDSQCCKFDSVVEFEILEPPAFVSVFHISCDSTPYLDVLGRSWYGCKFQFPITIPKSTSEYQCDSTILLTSAFFTFDPVWTVYCNSGSTEINLNYKPDACYYPGQTHSPFESINLLHSWYQKDDPMHNVLSNSSSVFAVVTGTYCDDVSIDITSVTHQNSKCTKTFCYQLKKDTLTAGTNQLGPDKLCADEIGVYKAFSTDTNAYAQEWTASDHPLFNTKDSIFNNNISLSWHEPGIKNICIRHYFKQNSSCLICQKVNVVKAAQATRDFNVIGFQTRMRASKVDNGKWRLISGPGIASFSNPYAPDTKVYVSTLGKYEFEWTASLLGCTDIDSIIINFAKLAVIYKHQFGSDDHHLTIRDDEIPQNQLSQVLNPQTPSLIHSNGNTFLKFNDQISFDKLEFNWMNSYGAVVIKGVINPESCSSDCKIPSPITSGLYFLMLQTEEFSWIQKIVVVD